MIRVFASGVLDFFHEGHRLFLRSAKEYGDQLFVGISRDENVLSRKGFLPYFSEKDRQEKVISSNVADSVLLGEKKDIFSVVKKINPHILALGYDQHIPSGFQEIFPHIRIVRIPSKKPEQWKSSIFRKKFLEERNVLEN